MPFKNSIRLLIILVAGIYLHGIIKPVIPLLKDVVAHAFFELEHIATVHHEHGHNHTHTEIHEEAEEEHDHNTYLSFESLSEHLAYIESFALLSPFKQPSDHATAYIKHIPLIYPDTPFAPPKI